MTPPKKPEWFELTESDRVKPRTSVKRSARGVLLALPLLLIGVGVVVAQGTDESPAVAESITTLASAVPQVNAAPSAAVKSSLASLTNPSIAIPPTGGGDDDDDEEEDEGDENEEEDEGDDD
jgi:hypothetical protein